MISILITGLGAFLASYKLLSKKETAKYSKISTPSVLQSKVVLSCETEMPFNVTKKISAFGSFTKKFLSVKENKTGNEVFDSKVYIQTDISEVVEIVKNDQQLQSLMIAILSDTKVDSVKSDGNYLHITPSGSGPVYKKNLDYIIGNLSAKIQEFSSLLELKAKEANKKSHQSIKKELNIHTLADKVINFNFALVGCALAQNLVYSIFYQDRYYPVFPFNFSVIIYLSLMIAALQITTSTYLCKNSTRRPSVFGVSLICSMLACVSLSFHTFNILNVTLDRTPAKVVSVNYDAVKTGSGKGVRYSLYFKSAIIDDTQEDLLKKEKDGLFAVKRHTVSLRAYNSGEKNGFMKVQMHSGFLGTPYYEVLRHDPVAK